MKITMKNLKMDITLKEQLILIDFVNFLHHLSIICDIVKLHLLKSHKKELLNVII